MAFEPGRGRTAVPVRSALVTTALALASVVAVFTFATNLDRLVDTPARYGWNWTATSGFGFDPSPHEMTDRLVAERGLDGVAGGTLGDLTVEGHTVTVATFDQLKGRVEPAILEGRAARAADELVLGTRTLDTIGRSVGDRVRVEMQDHTGTMRIVGRAVFPRLGAGSFTPTDIGAGAAMTAGGAARLGVEAADPSDPAARYSIYFLHGAPGVSLTALRSRLNPKLAGLIEECPSPGCLLGPQRPGDIVAYGRVRSTSLSLIVLLALMAIAALAHSLVTSVRRRRRDIAVLKTLGFAAADVASAARWQGLALAGVALAAGIPLGLIAGRAFWTVFAQGLGVADDVTFPVVALAIAVPVTLALAAVVAVIPARLAQRTATRHGVARPVTTLLTLRQTRASRNCQNPRHDQCLGRRASPGILEDRSNVPRPSGARRR